MLKTWIYLLMTF